MWEICGGATELRATRPVGFKTHVEEQTVSARRLSVTGAGVHVNCTSAISDVSNFSEPSPFSDLSFSDRSSPSASSDLSDLASASPSDFSFLSELSGSMDEVPGLSHLPMESCSAIELVMFEVQAFRSSYEANDRRLIALLNRALKVTRVLSLNPLLAAPLLFAGRLPLQAPPVALLTHNQRQLVQPGLDLLFAGGLSTQLALPLSPQMVHLRIRAAATGIPLETAVEELQP
ncbi:hypothetical protein EYF80_013146 [Liparis tanakae]|uniref:Uncharacterized protein n=1 Tax=Liparis tanakae TaxID=230148 RepID=A0A4Z2IGX1_9TELE|nr:hypothetical protein EYF80_013146 [Liparis tanakae]